VIPWKSAGAALAPFTEQLQMRMQQVPDPPTPRRNPFVFGARQRPAPTGDGARVEPPAPIVDAPMVAPVGPIYELSGIGVTREVRTAILSDGKSVVIAKPGAMVGGYKVVEITDSTVILADDSGARHTLRLR
jgi:hypothetical protein